MDKKDKNEIKDHLLKFNGEELQMAVLIKKEPGNKGLSLSQKKLDEITIKPKVENGKILFDRKKEDHRYIVDEEI